GEALCRSAHQLNLTDAGLHDVFEDRFRALIRHAAIAVRDRADVDAVDDGIRPGLSQGRQVQKGSSRKARKRQLSYLTPRVQHDVPSLLKEEYTDKRRKRRCLCVFGEPRFCWSSFPAPSGLRRRIPKQSAAAC